MKIDITTSATIRPALLERTLSSFRSGMLSNDYEYRFIINIDPIGESASADDVLNVARSHFKEVIFRKPDVPCFAGAVIWCWQQTTSDIVFHLEDDWVLLQPVNLASALKTIADFPQYDSFRLSKRYVPVTNESRVQPSNRNRLALNPVFIRNSFIQQAVRYMLPTKNPEKQLRITDPECGDFIKKTQHGIYVEQGPGPIIIDIGREWMEQTKLYSKKTGFLRWKPCKK